MSSKYHWVNTADEPYPNPNAWTDLKNVGDKGRGWAVTYVQQTEWAENEHRVHERTIWRVMYRDELEPESIPIANYTEEELRQTLYQRALLLGILKRYEEDICVKAPNET